MALSLTACLLYHTQKGLSTSFSTFLKVFQIVSSKESFLCDSQINLPLSSASVNCFFQIIQKIKRCVSLYYHKGKQNLCNLFNLLFYSFQIISKQMTVFYFFLADIRNIIGRLISSFIPFRFIISFGGFGSTKCSSMNPFSSKLFIYVVIVL